jgi:hypothetical protein
VLIIFKLIEAQNQGVCMNTEMIDHTTLTRLVEAGAIHATAVVGQSDGWNVSIKYGTTERLLGA